MLAAGALSCGDKRAPTAPVAASEPSYPSALDPKAPLVLLVRPEALRRDEVFGPLVSALSRLAAARGISGDRELEAFESAEEVVIAMDAESLRPGRDVLAATSGVVALRGVRADLAPEKLLDGDGRLLFRSARPRGRVTEHEGYAEEPIALFVLPKRTWVVAFGAATSRARAALSEAKSKAAPSFDPEALLELRIDGASLVERAPKLERGDLALGRRLDEIRFVLKPGRGGAQVTLRYADDDAAAWAENTLVRIVKAFSRRLEGAFAWLGSATVVREGANVRVRVAVPARVVEALRSVDTRVLLDGLEGNEGSVGDAGAPSTDAGLSGSDAWALTRDAGLVLDAGAPPKIPATRPKDAGK
jgi:hypothetical protein